MPGPSRLLISLELDSIVQLSKLAMSSTGSDELLEQLRDLLRGKGLDPDRCTCADLAMEPDENSAQMPLRDLARRVALFCAGATAGEAGLMPDESGDLRTAICARSRAAACPR